MIRTLPGVLCAGSAASYSAYGAYCGAACFRLGSGSLLASRSRFSIQLPAERDSRSLGLASAVKRAGNTSKHYQTYLGQPLPFSKVISPVWNTPLSYSRIRLISVKSVIVFTFINYRVVLFGRTHTNITLAAGIITSTFFLTTVF